MANPIIYRKRLIPEECILLKDDTVLHRSPEIIVTKWNSLKPRKDLHHGCSCYYLQEGIKVSRFYKEDDTLLFWYCDIVDYSYHEDTDTYIVTDLLADVIVYPDGFVKVVDLDELVTARKVISLRCRNLLKNIFHPYLNRKYVRRLYTSAKPHPRES